MINLDDPRAGQLIATVRRHLGSDRAPWQDDLECIQQLDAAASPRLKVELDSLRAQVAERIRENDSQEVTRKPSQQR